MLRSSRTIASLIRYLMLGTAATVATATLATTLIGCQDESQPGYWVDKLKDASWRPRAIKRLQQFYEDATTKSNGNNKAPEVQALLGKIIAPLTDTYVSHYGDLDTKTRVTLIQLLAEFRDKRAEPALKKAFTEFAAHPTGNKDESDIKWAARAEKDLKLASLGDPMLKAFLKLQAHTMLGGISYRDMNEAMVAAPQKSWEGPLIEMLSHEMKIPKDRKDVDKIDDYRDQQFWQTTSAEVLGEIRDPQAVEPLMKVMVDPTKGDVQSTAVLALTKIGQPSVDAAEKLLDGSDSKLVDYCLRRIQEATGSKETPKNRPYVQTAALVLGTAGRPSALPAMLAALRSEKSEVNRAILAREITKIPATPESKEAFEHAYESISLDTVIPPSGTSALEMLTEAAGSFYDPTMIPWLLERAAKTKGNAEDKKALQGTITITALKLAKPDQIAQVKSQAVDRYGTQIEKDAYKLTDALLKSCGETVSCYLNAIQQSKNQEQKSQFAGIKAAYMLGILGNDQTRDKLVDELDSIDNAAVKFTAAQAIDHLSPKGSTETADKLKKILDKDAVLADQDKIMADAPLKSVMYRVRARAE
jgi:cellobiose-specific phosphotransferase system component IIA